MSKTLAVETYPADPQDIVDVGGASFEVLLQLRPADAYVVRPLERFHALIQRSEGCLGLSLERWHERRILTSGAKPSTRKKGLDFAVGYWTDIAAEAPSSLGNRGRFGVREADCVVDLANAEVRNFACSSALIRAGAPGSANRIVPSATDAAPAATRLERSRPEVIPPIRRSEARRLVARIDGCSAIGLSAAQRGRPRRGEAGFRVCSSRARPRIRVDEREPSVPAFWAARLPRRCSAVAGESLV